MTEALKEAGEMRLFTSKPWTKDEVIELDRLMKEGLTYKEIAKILGRGVDSVEKKAKSIKKLGIDEIIKKAEKQEKILQRRSEKKECHTEKSVITINQKQNDKKIKDRRKPSKLSKTLKEKIFSQDSLLSSIILYRNIFVRMMKDKDEREVYSLLETIENYYTITQNLEGAIALLETLMNSGNSNL